MIKAIAVDMDGTFLNSHKDYNRKLFAKLFAQMRTQNIKFIVASGNQSYQLYRYFPEHFNEITFVAENGALVLNGQTEIFSAHFDQATLNKIYHFLYQEDLINFCLSGKKSAYVLKNADLAYQNELKHYCPRLKVIEHLNEIDDQIFKFNLNVAASQTALTQQLLNTKLKNYARATSSGHGDIDIILPHINKAYGLTHALNQWSLSADELAAFGDGGNDLEMLQFANYSYAMANSYPEVFKVAKTVVPSNDDDGVLTTIKKILALK